MPRYSQDDLRRNRENKTELKLIDLEDDITNKNKFFTTKTDPKTIVIVQYLGEKKFKYYPHFTVDPTADVNGYEITARMIKWETKKIRFIPFEMTSSLTIPSSITKPSSVTAPLSGTTVGDPIVHSLDQSGGKTRKSLKKKKSKKSKKSKKKH